VESQKGITRPRREPGGPRFAEPFGEDDAPRARLGRHWCVADAGEYLPEGWEREPLPGGCVFAAHPWARVEVRRSASAVAVSVGVAVDPLSPHEQLVDAIDLEVTGAALRQALVAALKRFGGMYTVILSCPEGTWLSSDPAGMAQVFHLPGRAASSVGLLGAVQRDHDIDAQFPLRGYDDWYTGSTTPYRNVRVLLANHLLDLQTGDSCRFWPTADFPKLDRDDGIGAMAYLLRGMVDAAATQGPLLASITGGRDSRVCLAALRDRRSETEFFTLRAAQVKACDLEIPEELARKHELRHSFVESPPPEPWLLKLYDESASWMVAGGPREVAEGCRRVASPRYIHVNGNLAAIAKSYFWAHPWPRGVWRRALAKDFVTKAPCIWSGVDEWLASLPDLEPTTIYNLMYFEQKGGRYSGLRDTASGLFFDSFPPFNHRDIFGTLCGLQRRDQYGGRLLRELVGALWPDLLETRYCPVTRSWGAYVPKRWKQVARRLVG